MWDSVKCLTPTISANSFYVFYVNLFTLINSLPSSFIFYFFYFFQILLIIKIKFFFLFIKIKNCRVLFLDNLKLSLFVCLFVFFNQFLLMNDDKDKTFRHFLLIKIKYRACLTVYIGFFFLHENDRICHLACLEFDMC